MYIYIYSGKPREWAKSAYKSLQPQSNVILSVRHDVARAKSAAEMPPCNLVGHEQEQAAPQPDHSSLPRSLSLSLRLLPPFSPRYLTSPYIHHRAAKASTAT